jgi:hypothetical protein
MPVKKMDSKVVDQRREEARAKDRKKGIRWHKGELHAGWKGDSASYNAIHMWLKKYYGTPMECENKKCSYPRTNKNGKVLLKPSKFEYALKHGKNYSHNRNNFITLCVSCHAIYDKRGLGGQERRKANHGLQANE